MLLGMQHHRADGVVHRHVHWAIKWTDVEDSCLIGLNREASSRGAFAKWGSIPSTPVRFETEW